LKTAATVAVASSVHGRVRRRQEARWAEQDQLPPPPPPVPAPAPAPAPAQHAYTEPVSPPPAVPPQSVNNNDRLSQLKQLGGLLSAGVLTQAEFEQQKALILNG